MSCRHSCRGCPNKQLLWRACRAPLSTYELSCVPQKSNSFASHPLPRLLNPKPPPPDTRPSIRDQQRTFPSRSLPSPSFPKFSANTPLPGWNTISPFGPLAPYMPLRNCLIVSSSLMTFSTSPDARCSWYANWGIGPLTRSSVEAYLSDGAVYGVQIEKT